VIICRFLSGIIRSRLDAEPAAVLTIPEGRRGDLIHAGWLVPPDGKSAAVAIFDDARSGLVASMSVD
jgi:hypothetical protein